MKKLLLALSVSIILSVAFTSCSGSDDSTSVNTSTQLKFNPPAWIQGTWIHTNPVLANIGYKFTSDDFCTLTYDNSVCFKELLNQTLSVKQSATIDESVISDTEYNFTYTQQSVSQSFSFKRKSATKIVWISNGSEIELQKK